MPPLVALALCTVFVIILMTIEHRRNPDSSMALWLPTIWLLIYTSRPLKLWFEKTSYATNPGELSIDSGSPLDRATLLVLIFFALVILFRRKLDWHATLKANPFLFLWFFYLGISILWSDLQMISFKRWVRSTGDVFLALVVVTEILPYQSLESVFRRCAYILIPFSLVLSKYFPGLGREYSTWIGMEMWTGVTLQKNCLGQLCALALLFLIWSHFKEKRGSESVSFSEKSADFFVGVIAFFLLIGPSNASRSATAVGMLAMGLLMLIGFYYKSGLLRLIANNLKKLAIFLSVSYILFFNLLKKTITGMLGRDETLTGRTEIWPVILDYADKNPVLGVGYGGFWARGTGALEEVFGGRSDLSQAHNGYIAIYVELGAVGLALLAVLILACCHYIQGKSEKAFDWTAFTICIIPMLLIANNSESIFMNSSSYLWSSFFFIMVVVTISQVDQKLSPIVSESNATSRYPKTRYAKKLRTQDS